MNAPTDAMFFAPLDAQTEAETVTLDIELGGMPAVVYIDCYSLEELWVDRVSVGGADIDGEYFDEGVREAWCNQYRAQEAA